MKKNRRVGIYATIAVVIGALLLYFWLTSDSIKRYQWFESYSAESEQPYGTAYFKKLLAAYRPHEKFKYNSKQSLTEFLPANPSEVTDYVFVGGEFYLSTADAEALFKFVGKGNNALIAATELPHGFISHFSDTACMSISFDDYEALTVNMNFYHPSLRLEKDVPYTRRLGATDQPRTWHTISLPDSCDFSSSVTPLGFLTNHGVNFFKVPYEKGFFYFHTEPLVFTNYFLTKKNHLAYTERVVSHLTGKDILWDEFSKLPELQEKGKSSPLYFILQQPALKYAWWLLLIAVVLYVCFAAKREQRVIPVLEPKINTSLEFVNLIAALHFQNGNPIDMARKKMRYFLYFVRSKYGIQAPVFGPEQIALLSVKSTVPKPEVSIIFEHFSALENHTNFRTQADKLLDLFYSIENFNSKCR